MAEWREGGRTRQRKFSILKYGDDLARSLAMKARQHGIAETRGYGKVAPTEKAKETSQTEKRFEGQPPHKSGQRGRLGGKTRKTSTVTARGVSAE